LKTPFEMATYHIFSVSHLAKNRRFLLSTVTLVWRGRGGKAMIQEAVERRSEFRFPVVVPVEYFSPDDSGILSYCLDLNKGGTFISSDDPLTVGSRFDMHLTIPANDESSKIFGTEGEVPWNKIQPFKSKRSGMGVKFIEPLSEKLSLNALSYNYRELVKETKAKKVLEERVEKLDSELEEAKKVGSPRALHREDPL